MYKIMKACDTVTVLRDNNQFSCSINFFGVLERLLDMGRMFLQSFSPNRNFKRPKSVNEVANDYRTFSASGRAHWA